VPAVFMCATPFSMYYVALGVSLGVGVLATLFHMWFVHRDARVTSHVLKYVGGPWPWPWPWPEWSGARRMAWLLYDISLHCIALHCAGAC
jgi:hypothetical protein